MTRFVCTGILAAAAGLWAGAGRAAAQPPGPPRLGSAPPPPGYSPYLNLLRGGNPGVNYYGLVRPQQNFQAAIQNLQAQQFLAGSGAAPAADGAGLPGTGIPVQFMNHHVYFMNLGGAGAALQAPARPAPRGR